VDRALRSLGGDRRIALRSACVVARTEISHYFGAIEVATADLAFAAPGPPDFVAALRDLSILTAAPSNS
jgi:hypothetical protein